MYMVIQPGSERAGFVTRSLNEAEFFHSLGTYVLLDYTNTTKR